MNETNEVNANGLKKELLRVKKDLSVKENKIKRLMEKID